MYCKVTKIFSTERIVYLRNESGTIKHSKEEKKKNFNPYLAPYAQSKS